MLFCINRINAAASGLVHGRLCLDAAASGLVHALLIHALEAPPTDVLDLEDFVDDDFIPVFDFGMDNIMSSMPEQEIGTKSDGQKWTPLRLLQLLQPIQYVL